MIFMKTFTLDSFHWFLFCSADPKQTYFLSKLRHVHLDLHILLLFSTFTDNQIKRESFIGHKILKGTEKFEKARKTSFPIK